MLENVTDGMRIHASRAAGSTCAVWMHLAQPCTRTPHLDEVVLDLRMSSGGLEGCPLEKLDAKLNRRVFERRRVTVGCV